MLYFNKMYIWDFDVRIWTGTVARTGSNIPKPQFAKKCIVLCSNLTCLCFFQMLNATLGKVGDGAVRSVSIQRPNENLKTVDSVTIFYCLNMTKPKQFWTFFPTVLLFLPSISVSIQLFHFIPDIPEFWDQAAWNPEWERFVLAAPVSTVASRITWCKRDGWTACFSPKLRSRWERWFIWNCVYCRWSNSVNPNMFSKFWCGYHQLRPMWKPQGESVEFFFLLRFHLSQVFAVAITIALLWLLEYKNWSIDHTMDWTFVAFPLCVHICSTQCLRNKHDLNIS